jgi:hypothetical protein
MIYSNLDVVWTVVSLILFFVFVVFPAFYLFRRLLVALGD